MRPLLLLLSIFIASVAQGTEKEIIKLLVKKRTPVWRTTSISSTISFYLTEKDTAYVLSYVSKKKNEFYSYYYVINHGQRGYIADDENIRIDLAQRNVLLAEKGAELGAREQATFRADDVRRQAGEQTKLVARNRSDSIDKRNSFIRDSVANRKKEIADSISFAQMVRETDSALRELKKVTDALVKKFAPYGLGITKWSWNYEHEYSYAPDLEISVFNPTKKKIRYVHVTISAWDAVDGRLTNFGRSTATLKGIGPIETEDFATWSFERVFYSKVINEIKLESVKVDYFDGTSKIISNPQRIIW